MATTVLDILTDVAYRLGEDGNPDDANEQNRRISYINQVYRHVLRERYWWFTQKDYGMPTVADNDTYALPSDYRDMVDVRLNGDKVEFVPDFMALASQDRPRDEYGVCGDYGYYIWNGNLYLLPEASSAPTAYSVSGITVSGTLATVTTTTSHGLEIGDYVTIAGASVSTFNASHLVSAVPSPTTFKIVVASGTSEPTGTMTATQDNLVLSYYYTPAKLTTTASELVIPDMYADVISSYVFGRVAQLDSERGDAKDGFDEHTEILTQMVIDNNKRSSWGKGVSAE